MKFRVKSLVINTVAIGLVYIVLSVLNNFGPSTIQGKIIEAGINVLAAVSLNLTVGLLGDLALGHAGFMAVGAYASALFSIHYQPAWLAEPVRFIVALLFGGVVAAVFGVIIGIPALRLKGDYLAIITLGFGEIIRVLLNNMEKLTGGATGLSGIPEYTNFNNLFFIVVLSIIIVYNFKRSRHGRAVTAIREDEIAAEASGVPVTYYKMLTFVLTAFLGGIAGSLYSHFFYNLTPSSWGFQRSIDILVIVVLGGMGSITGSIIAAIILTLLPELLRGFDQYRMLLYSVVLIVMMIFKPSGIFGRYEFSLTRVIDRIFGRKKEDVYAGGSSNIQT